MAMQYLIEILFDFYSSGPGVYFKNNGNLFITLCIQFVALATTVQGVSRTAVTTVLEKNASVTI